MEHKVLCVLLDIEVGSKLKKQKICKKTFSTRRNFSMIQFSRVKSGRPDGHARISIGVLESIVLDRIGLCTKPLAPLPKAG